MTDTHTQPTASLADQLTFHITNRPEDGMVADQPTAGDPNAIFFWKGRYHFHYFGSHSGSIDSGSGAYTNVSSGAYAHVSSPDLVHWTWHPTVLRKATTGHGLLSGSGFITKEGRPAIIYASIPGEFGTADTVQLGPVQIVQAEDDQLDSWSAPTAIEPRVSDDAAADIICPWDPHGWLEGDTYYAIYGSPQPLPFLTGGKPKKLTLHRSADLESWDYVGPFLTTDLPDAAEDTDISCPDFFPLGNEHMLLCISHNLGCRYYLGEWKDERFTPTRHGRMNWLPTSHHAESAEGDVDSPRAGGRAVFFAPETLLTPDGRRVMWAWCSIEGLQNGIQSLPRELSLPGDGILRIAPLRELETLRTDEVTVPGIEVASTGIHVVDGVGGDTLELSVTFRPGSAERFGIVVLCDADGQGGLPLTVETITETVAVGDTAAPFTPTSGSVTLRVFIDKAMVEIFADDTQAVIGAHPHPPANTHIGLFADAPITADLIAWQLRSIYTDSIAHASQKK